MPEVRSSKPRGVAHLPRASALMQKERSPGSLPGFVWFRVPKLAPQLLANSGGGLELHFGVGSARGTTETFPGAFIAALLSNLQSSLRWLRGSVFSSLRYARTSAVLALRKSILASAPLREICGSVFDCACIWPNIKAPGIFRSSSVHHSFVKPSIKGRERPVPASIDIAHFAPLPPKGQYPRGEQQVHFP